MSSGRVPPKERKKYYILLENLHIDPQHDKIHLAGSLWTEENLVSEFVYLVRKYEGEDIGDLQEMRSDVLREIKYDEVHLLLAVPGDISQRLQIVNHSDWLGEGCRIAVGSVVEIHDVPEIPNAALATVRYKGRLPARNGTYFGVELHPEHAGKGSTNGTYRRKKLFTCDEDCGLFLSLLRIRYYYGRSRESGARPKERQATEGAERVNSIGQTDNASHHVLTISERVVWFSDTGPEIGTVRWQGKLPNSSDNKFIVGVEFDRPVGTGTGKYRGHQLFSCKRNHASLLPILGLMKLSEFEKMFTPTNDIDGHNGQSGSNSRDNMSPEKQRQSFASGNLPHPSQNGLHGHAQRQPQEHKDVNDSGYDQVVSANQVPSSSQKNMSEKINQISSGISSMNLQLNRSARFASTKMTSVKEEDTYEPPLLLAPDGKYPNPSTSYKDLSQKSTLESSLQLGDRVVVTLGQEEFGIIRWIGHILESKHPERVFAGLEMDRENKIYTSGTWQHRKIFDCPDKRGLFIDLEKCKKVAY